MPTRPTLGARLNSSPEPRGAGAYFDRTPGTRRRSPGSESPETVSPADEPKDLTALRETGSGRRRAPKWEESNQRASFYLPVDLLHQLDGVAGAGLSKSQIVTAALRQYLRAGPG